jgi:alkylation response protein AidB-like acyl-CoA dehydrogenase
LARDFAEKEAKSLAETFDKNHKPEDCISLDLLRRSSGRGFRALAIPEKYGGGGVEDLLAVAVVCEELAVADVALPTIPANGRKIFAILNNPEVANKETRGKWLRAFCEDPTFMIAMAVTEPDAGGDNTFPYSAPGAGVRTSAVRDGDHYALNGMKHFIAQGGGPRGFISSLPGAIPRKVFWRDALVSSSPWDIRECLLGGCTIRWAPGSSETRKSSLIIAAFRRNGDSARRV